MTNNTDELGAKIDVGMQELDKLQREVGEIEGRNSFWKIRHADYEKTHDEWLKLLSERKKLRDIVSTQLCEGKIS